MSIRLPRLRLMRFWVLLLLAAIGLQAALPAGAPLQQLQGSAFNASTVDVAVTPQRQGDTREGWAAPQPPEPLLSPPDAAFVLPLATTPAWSWPFAAAGLIIHHIRSWHPSPRAPPRA